MPRHDTLEGQLQAFDDHFNEAMNLIAHLAEHNRPAIRVEAKKRLIAGWWLYGHGTWERSEDEIWDEALQEAADQANYHIMQLEKRRIADRNTSNGA